MTKSSISSNKKQAIKVILEELSQLVNSTNATGKKNKPTKDFIIKVKSITNLIFYTTEINGIKSLKKPDFTHWKIGYSRIPIVSNTGGFLASWKINRDISVAVVNWFIHEGMDEITPKDVQVQNEVYITLQYKYNIH